MSLKRKFHSLLHPRDADSLKPLVLLTMLHNFPFFSGCTNCNNQQTTSSTINSITGQSEIWTAGTLNFGKFVSFIYSFFITFQLKNMLELRERKSIASAHFNPLPFFTNSAYNYLSSKVSSRKRRGGSSSKASSASASKKPCIEEVMYWKRN